MSPTCFVGARRAADEEIVDKGHGRLEVRQLRVSSELVGYSDWPGLAQVAELRTRRIILKTGEVPSRSATCSPACRPTRLHPSGCWP